MIPLESENEAVLRLTQGEIICLPKCEKSMKEPTIVKCHKSGQEFCCEKCKQEADLAFDRMLLPLRAQLDEIEDLWRDIHFPPETATITLVYRLLAMKRLDPQVNEYLESLGQGCEVGKIFIEIFVNFH